MPLGLFESFKAKSTLVVVNNLHVTGQTAIHNSGNRRPLGFGSDVVDGGKVTAKSKGKFAYTLYTLPDRDTRQRFATLERSIADA